MVDDERRHIVRGERREVDVVGPRVGANLVGIEDAATVPADATGRLSPDFANHRASVVAGIAGAGIRTAIVGVADKAARPGSCRGYAASGLVDRRRIAGGVEPSVEVVPAERAYHTVAVRIVALDSDVEFAEHRALVTALLEIG